MFEELKEILKKSKRILIVTPEHINLDSMGASVAIANTLTPTDGLSTIVTNTYEYTHGIEEKLGARIQNVVAEVANSHFAATLPANREIKDVNIVKETDVFRIILDTKAGKLLDPKIEFRPEPSSFDLAIIIGTDDIQKGSLLYQSIQSKGIKIAYTLALSSTGENVTRSGNNFVFAYNRSSVSEIVMFLLSSLQIHPDPETATLLLAGTFFNTHNLRINTSRITIKNVYELVHNLNADLKRANEMCNHKLDQAHTIWFKEIFENVKINKNFCYSVVDSPTITSETIGKLTNEDKVIISKIKGCDIALTLIKLNSKLHGFLKSDTKQYSALALTREFEKIGNEEFVHFWTDKSEQAIIDHIHKLLGLNPVAFVRPTSRDVLAEGSGLIKPIPQPAPAVRNQKANVARQILGTPVPDTKPQLVLRQKPKESTTVKIDDLQEVEEETKKSDEAPKEIAEVDKKAEEQKISTDVEVEENFLPKEEKPKLPSAAPTVPPISKIESKPAEAPKPQPVTIPTTPPPIADYKPSFTPTGYNPLPTASDSDFDIFE